ncbi:hypothetical protein niasHT_036425 [Heterodera trifolii]|uniref:Uncharacterized protein n=1 Tax=Heterodera trifolii TaxID=157864 RepID=A0ABD2I901_9BILA
MAQYFSTSIPNFHLGKETQTAILIDVLDSLIHIWAFFFDSTYRIQFHYKLENMFEKFPHYELKLLNEQEFEQFEKNGQKIVQTLKDKKIFGSQNQTKHLKKGKKNENSVGLLHESEEKSCINADEKAISALREEFGGMMKEKAEKVVKIIYSEEEGIGKMKKELEWLVK